MITWRRRLSATPPTLDERLCVYWDVDQIVFEQVAGADAEEATEFCYVARRLAKSLRLRYGGRRAAEVADSYGIEVITAEWQAAQGRVVHLAECTRRPPRIRVNTLTVKQLARCRRQWAETHVREWFTEETIAEAATAHELFHMLGQRPSSPGAELIAHAFARAFTGLPFSPLLYHELLRARLIS